MTVFIGLMSGTSADGMDAALVEFGLDGSIQLIDALCHSYSDAFRAELKKLAVAEFIAVDSLMTCERTLAIIAADACNQLLKRNALEPSAISAIGSHGHTVRHKPQPDGYSWQINDPSYIAEKTGIACIADFRRRDIAAGGHGAPLVPAFHQFCLQQRGSESCAMILNIGGIANLTVMGEPLLGFDTGPGNALMDEWCQRHWQQAYDHDGQIARHGTLQEELLNRWLQHPYFQLQPPKSTGRELFNLNALDIPADVNAGDILATLTELTVQSIAQAIDQVGHATGALYVCGGGIDNAFLLQRLQLRLPRHDIKSSTMLGINPHWMEAIAFAWLAKQRIDCADSNTSSVTGAQGARILGGWYSR